MIVKWMLPGMAAICLLGLAPQATSAELTSSILERSVLDNKDNHPQFEVEKTVDFPDPGATTARLETAFVDMLKMAGIACITFNDDEDVFDRYFGEEDVDDYLDLIKYTICNVAGIDDPTEWTPKEWFDKTPIHKTYKKWIITGGPTSKIPPAKRPFHDAFTIAATTFQNIKTNLDVGSDDDAAITEVYLRGFDFPKIDDIMDNRGVQGLGFTESGLMTSLGAQLLHEAFHWRFLARTKRNAHDWDQTIPHDVTVQDPEGAPGETIREEHDYIDDYERDTWQNDEDKEVDPPDGYGPYHCFQLVTDDARDSRRNADNYRWYVVSKFWMWKYDKKFADDLDEALGDQMIPEGANGKVPFNGEKPPSTSRRLRWRQSAD